MTDAGLMLLMDGVGLLTTTVNALLLAAVPPGAVTLIGPLVAAAGTVAVICVSLFTVYTVTAVPLNFTAVAPVNPLPVMDTTVPTVPLAGLKLLIAGAATTV